MIWGGKGVWVFPIILLCVLCLGPGVVWVWIGGPGHPESDKTVEFAPAVSIGFLLAGILCYLLGRRVNRSTGRSVIDRVTGRLKIEQAYHHCFFVKVEYWGVLCLLMGAVIWAESFF
jgi:hypothetical protein